VAQDLLDGRRSVDEWDDAQCGAAFEASERIGEEPDLILDQGIGRLRPSGMRAADTTYLARNASMAGIT
jgi:hypothetical protein